MSKILKIGILREGKVPPDYRVALTPNDCIKLKNLHPNIELQVQSSSNRAYKDEEYIKAGVEVVESVENCDVLLGVKEVPVDALIAEKTYFYFSHTIKKQRYNRLLLQTMIQKNIRMIDYETLVDDAHNRLIGFGLYAGIVGAHYALLMHGLKTGMYELKPAKDCKDFVEMVTQYKKIKFPNFKIVVTGTGKVARGAMQVLEAANIRKVEPKEFLEKEFEYPVYTNLTSKELYIKDNQEFDKKDFYQNPQQYQSNFSPYAQHADILINGIFWNQNIPRLFEKEDIQNESFNISSISDVSCDIDGSVPLTIKASTIAEPLFAINRNTLQEVEFSMDKGVIGMMTVDNLPNELPRDASASFGNTMVDIIIPELLKEKSEILDRATICQQGALTENFSYLQDFVDGH